jgi:hypothetical protein
MGDRRKTYATVVEAEGRRRFRRRRLTIRAHLRAMD